MPSFLYYFKRKERTTRTIKQNQNKTKKCSLKMRLKSLSISSEKNLCMNHWLLCCAGLCCRVLFGKLVVRICLILPSIWCVIFPPTLLFPLSGPSNDEDYVWWKLQPERASQELVPHGGAGSLQGGEKLHRLSLPQWPLRGSVHSHHRGLPSQGLQHTGRHVSAGHPGHLWESPFPCHEEAFHPNRWESQGEGHKDRC